MGTSGGRVYSVALGDLDGDLDIVSGSGSGEDCEVIAWQNDGSPFSGTWTQNDAGASDDTVKSVALGDLDQDGDLDIVSGSASGEDYEVMAWENDSSPFSGYWPQGNVGASAGSVFSVALGDLDIASGSGSQEDYEVMAWANDGFPFSALWSQNDVGASRHIFSVAVGDLEHNGALDIVSGGSSVADYELIAWRNLGSDWYGHVPLTLKNYTP